MNRYIFLFIDCFIFRTFILPCKGQGVLPAVQLSDNIIHFTATPVNATSSTSIIIQNVKFNRLSSARIRQAVPTPGKRVFEFCIPKNCPVSLSPSVGILEPGQVNECYKNVEIDAKFSHVETTDSS